VIGGVPAAVIGTSAGGAWSGVVIGWTNENPVQSQLPRSNHR
jgi:hypothetical protein